MPGLFGWTTRGNPFAPSALLQKNSAPAAGEPRLYLTEPDVTLGSQERSRPPAAASYFSGDRYVIGLYGHCLDPVDGRQLGARDIDPLWQEEGEAVLKRLEGAFYLVILDRRARRLSLVNDRVGFLPLYYHLDRDIFSFGPRLRWLARREASWEPNPGAVITFLSVGHYLGPSTQVKQARLLTPATILEVDLDSLAVSERRYWNLVYDPDTKLSAAEHCRRLGVAIWESTELLSSPDAGKPGIFLSGGWDSRSVLGAMLALQRPPQLVVTNGRSDEIPFADTWLAKKMAAEIGLPFRFCRRVPDAGPKKWLDGLHRGEISTANNPENFGLHQLPPEAFAEVDFMFKGDVMWGYGDPAPTRVLSIGKMMPYPLMDNVKEVLQGDLASRSDRLYEEEIDGVMRHCEHEDWTDRRDYLWQMAGINRYILGLGFSDEEHIQVRRPLLTGKVFEVYTKVPQPLRIQKNLFIQSIKEFYPRLFAYGRNHSSNIAYYYVYMAPFVRERTLAHLASGNDLWGLLDKEACRRITEAFQPVETPTYIPGWKARVYNRLHDRFSYRIHRTRFYSERKPKVFKTSSTQLAFHIYLLLEWFHGRPD